MRHGKTDQERQAKPAAKRPLYEDQRFNSNDFFRLSVMFCRAVECVIRRIESQEQSRRRRGSVGKEISIRAVIILAL